MPKSAFLPTGLLAAGALLLGACADTPTQPTAAMELAPSSAMASAGATVYVIHGINGLDLGATEALPVDVEVNGGCALEGFTFRDIAGPLMLPAGSYDVKVRLADAVPCTGAVAIDASGLPLGDGDNVSIVAHLDADGGPMASVFANDLSRAPGRARVAAHHTADFGAVDVLVDGGVAFGGVTNGGQGVADLRPGRHLLAINVAGTGTSAWDASMVLNPFTFYAAYAVGTPENGTFEVLLHVLDIQRSAR